MKHKTWLISAMGALALGLLMAPAQAAPVSGVTGGFKIAAGENAGVEKVHRRYRHYKRHRHYGYRHYGYRPYWRHRRYGYRSYRRPGIHFYFGHRRHHRHHRRYHRHW